jgi:hypothetical protein
MGKKENRQSAAKKEIPPEPVSRYSILDDNSGDSQRCISSEGGGNHRGSKNPPGKVSAADKEISEASSCSSGIIDADANGEEHIPDNEKPVYGGKVHHFAL